MSLGVQEAMLRMTILKDRMLLDGEVGLVNEVMTAWDATSGVLFKQSGST